MGPLRKLSIIIGKDRPGGQEGVDPCCRETHLFQETGCLGLRLGFVLASDRSVEAAERPSHPNVMSFLKSKKALMAQTGSITGAFICQAPRASRRHGAGGGSVPSVEVWLRVHDTCSRWASLWHTLAASSDV